MELSKEERREVEELKEWEMSEFRGFGLEEGMAGDDRDGRGEGILSMVFQSQNSASAFHPTSFDLGRCKADVCTCHLTVVLLLMSCGHLQLSPRDQSELFWIKLIENFVWTVKQNYLFITSVLGFHVW